MYLFNFKQLRTLVVAFASLFALGTFFFAPSNSYLGYILYIASIASVIAVFSDRIVSKRFSVFLLFIIAIFVSFSHFLLNFSTRTSLVALVYAFSCLTLFVLLVTNYDEKQLIEH